MLGVLRLLETGDAHSRPRQRRSQKDLLTTMKEAFEAINKSVVVGSLGVSSGWHKDYSRDGA